MASGAHRPQQFLGGEGSVAQADADGVLQVFSEVLWRHFDVPEDFAKKPSSDISSGVNRDCCAATVGVHVSAMAGGRQWAICKTKPFEDGNQFLGAENRKPFLSHLPALYGDLHSLDAYDFGIL